MTIADGKIQTGGSEKWSLAKEQFLLELALHTGLVEDPGYLNGLQVIPCISDEACEAKLVEIGDKLKILEAPSAKRQRLG